MNEKWNNSTSFIDALRKLQELSLRAVRIDLAQRMARTQASMKALTPTATKEAKSNG